MGLIIKDKIQQLIAGYPTVSDKYGVAGAILEGSTPVKFGSMVKLGSTAGYFTAPASLTAATLGGFVVATNVKLTEDWPGNTVQVNPGEAFNLLVNGFIAVELASNVTIDDITPNAPVYVTAAGDVCGSSTTDAIAVPNATFTGLYEQQGTKYVAEIYVR